MELKTREEEIIQAAINIFSKNGFGPSKMEDIAIEAGIGKSTIYGYFSSKRELFEQMISYNMNQYKKELSNITLGPNSFSEKLDRLFRYHVKFIDQNIDIFQIINVNNIISDSMKKNFLNEQKFFLGLIEDMIKSSIFNGELREDIDIEVTALCIIGAINQIANKRIFIDKIAADNIDSKAMINVIIKGLL